MSHPGPPDFKLWRHHLPQPRSSSNIHDHSSCLKTFLFWLSSNYTSLFFFFFFFNLTILSCLVSSDGSSSSTPIQSMGVAKDFLTYSLSPKVVSFIHMTLNFMYMLRIPKIKDFPKVSHPNVSSWFLFPLSISSSPSHSHLRKIDYDLLYCSSKNIKCIPCSSCPLHPAFKWVASPADSTFMCVHFWCGYCHHLNGLLAFTLAVYLHSPLQNHILETYHITPSLKCHVTLYFKIIQGFPTVFRI